MAGLGRVSPAIGAALVCALCAEGGELWRLGAHDGSWREFRSYYAWEYGREPWVAASPDMDFATHTWTYRVPGPGLQKKLPFPCEICTRYENASMPDDEIVTGLRLVWNETTATNRLLRVDCASFFHWLGHGRRGIEWQFKDGRKLVFNLPFGRADNKKDCFKMEGVVPVRPGENEVTVRIVSLAKHYRIRFDSISLHETDAVPSFEPILSVKTDVFSGIAHPGESARAVFTLANAAAGTGTYVVYDHRTNEVARGVLTVADGCGTVALPTDRKGWYRVGATCGAARAETAYAVVEPPNDEFVADSRFGCHAIAGDGYFLRDTTFGRERAELKARRAYLGGAKWARVHYLSWACREPARGTYVWEDLDRRLALAEANKLRVMLNVVEVPAWNSPTNDSRLTVCGTKRYKMYPPADAAAWGRFVTQLVTRYRGRVEDFEIGNEPGFTSAFWMTGSPEDFAAYLKTAYEAAHRANPGCRIYPGAPLDVVFHEAVLKACGGKPFYDVLSGHYLDNGQRFTTKTAGWLALNAAYGMPREMINSEDMNWRGEAKNGQEAVAAHMVRLHVRDAARGVKRTFAFQVFDDLSGHYSFFDIFDAPHVTFPAYRTMTHRLEYAKYVGDLSTAEYEAYVFDRRGTPVVVFWNGLKVPFRAKLPLGTETATLADEMDNETSVRSADGTFELAADALPRYVEGGDWTAIRKALASWPKDPFADGRGNPVGQNMATVAMSQARTFRGRHFVPVAKNVPVRYGETYVFAAKIRGTGELNGIWSVCDKDGQELYPRRQGLNCLAHREGEPEWRTVSETVSVTWEGASKLSLTLVPNFFAKEQGALEIRDVVVARLSDGCSVSKALHCGTFGRAGYGDPVAVPGATVRVRMDDACLALAFDVEDDVFDPPADPSTAYGKDSVQFAVDPKNDGVDRTEFTAGRLADGTAFLFKNANYTTPELPDNLTRRGLVTSAKVDFAVTEKGWRLEVQIPLREVYPLKAGAKEFGFNFLVNDCDGGKRTYVEWTEGIGGAKRPSEFGCLRLADGGNVRPGAKIVFLGDSITHQGRYLRFIDEYLVNGRPGDGIRTYSAGVGGDRADLCLDRLARDVDRRKPDLIAIMLGMNDCMDEGAATNYEANVSRLVTRLKKSNPQARFIWMTPSPYDSAVTLSQDRLGPHPERADRLRGYAGFLRDWQRRHGGLLVDFNAAMEGFHRQVQAEDPTFTLCGKDRVHPEDVGGYFMARVFLRDIGLLPWTVPDSVASLRAELDAWRMRNDTPAGRVMAERAREQAELRTLHMIRWQLETLQHRNADDFDALAALEKSFNGRTGQFEDRVRRYLKEWPQVLESERRLDEMWTRAYARSYARYDLVIYGGSPAAITAAVKATDMGLKPVIVSPKAHLGGLSVSGLGFTDSGNTSAIGGLAREFYRRIYRAYQDPATWRWQKMAEFSAGGQGTKAKNDAERTMWTFEPHVAESVFAAWLAEKGVEVRRGEPLDREKGVVKENGRLVSITTRSGDTYTGRYFIDATYEGDLMAAAGVAYRVGREANDEYGETWNGNQVGVLHHGHHFRDWKISPYKVPGDPASGLCAEIETSAPGVRGEPDARVQAYCYRLCLTDDPRNRIPFERPAGYDPSRYALLARVYEQGYKETFSKFDRIANRKTDTNNHGPMNMDYIGHSSEWPEASDARRAELAKEHRDYQKGLLYFIANDPSVPEGVRREMSKWGLAKDEFVDNGGWPYELYVREGRRMVGEYVMTEHDCLDKKIHPKQGRAYGPVGMGSYALDSHNVRRYVTAEGHVQNEGDIGVRAKKPYGIDYGAIVPKRADCTNLLVPVALSATHTAFGSIRMEPVFMILGESAATAVALVAKDDRAVQDIAYDALAERLASDGQRLR